MSEEVKMALDEATDAMNKGIFINIDKNGCPVSVFIDRASDILNVKKEIFYSRCFNVLKRFISSILY